MKAKHRGTALRNKNTTGRNANTNVVVQIHVNVNGSIDIMSTSRSKLSSSISVHMVIPARDDIHMDVHVDVSCITCITPRTVQPDLTCCATF